MRYISVPCVTAEAYILPALDTLGLIPTGIQILALHLQASEIYGKRKSLTKQKRGILPNLCVITLSVRIQFRQKLYG